MQLFTLAGFFFSLAAFSLAAPTLELPSGPCEETKQRIGMVLPGKFVPKCTPSGYYEPKQCHGSTGYCWCVEPETGKELLGSRTAPGQTPLSCPPCHVKRAMSLKKGMIGAYVPQCDEYGMFMPTQYHGSTGHSWCVDKFTGEEYEGTRQMPGKERTEECTGSQYCRKNETEGRPCCAMFFQESSSVLRLQCTRNGYFKREQTVPFGETPFHFCVNPATGIMAMEAQLPNCGGCFQYIEDKVGGKQQLGADLPRCLDHTGQFTPLQKSHDGYRWCVDLNTGAVLSEKRRMDDKTPLHCELV